MQPKENNIHHKISDKLWRVIEADMFTSDNKNYICGVDNHSKYSVIRKTEGLSADSLILAL